MNLKPQALPETPRASDAEIRRKVAAASRRTPGQTAIVPAAHFNLTPKLIGVSCSY
jgi:hypothetical protein